MTSKRSVLVGVGVPVLVGLLLLFLVGPAAGHHKDGHTKGPKKSSKQGSSAVTEDNDGNDGGTPNNVADDGDNRHPSGKDKSVENGGSGNQGNSASDPDDDGHGPDRSNGGADKPDGPGGVDLADQDGNNGCGNDDDFEDDNEGWCGHKPKADKVAKRSPSAQPAAGKDGDEAKANDVVQAEEPVDVDVKVPCAQDATMVEGRCVAISDMISKDDDAEVLGERITRDDAPIATAVESTGTTDTLASTTAAGERAERSTLPLTGAGLMKFLLAASALVLAGLVMLKARRRA